jgi:hypothetical protein
MLLETTIVLVVLSGLNATDDSFLKDFLNDLETAMNNSTNQYKFKENFNFTDSGNNTFSSNKFGDSKPNLTQPTKFPICGPIATPLEYSCKAV